MSGEGARPELITADDSPVWDRSYSGDPGIVVCDMLAETLAAFSATQMVIGHTVQEAGITSACDGLVWRVDVGLSSYYGGPKQVLLHASDGQFSVLE